MIHLFPLGSIFSFQKWAKEPIHQKALLECGFIDTIKTLVFTGRPLRIKKNSHVLDWEENRLQELNDALKRGTVPYTIDVDKVTEPTPEDMKRMMESRPWLMGQVAGAIHDVKPAADIMKEMTIQAVEVNLLKSDSSQSLNSTCSSAL